MGNCSTGGCTVNINTGAHTGPGCGCSCHRALNNRELDALVAEKVMGCRCLSLEEASSHPMGKMEFVLYADWSAAGLGYYSTDIAAAWEVFESVGRGWSLRLEVNPRKKNQWVIEEVSRCGHDTDIDEIHSAESAPMAICLAALKAVGVEVG